MPRNTYSVYPPLDHKYFGFYLGKVTEYGVVIESRIVNIISKDGIEKLIDIINAVTLIKQGEGTPIENNLRCIPDWLDHPKSKDVIVLKKLVGRNHPRGSQRGLRPISPKDRFKGRDWESERIRIRGWRRQGWGIRRIAKELNVSPSTLSMANRKYKLYQT